VKQWQRQFTGQWKEGNLPANEVIGFGLFNMQA
jgi:hypothetical protein